MWFFQSEVLWKMSTELLIEAESLDPMLAMVREVTWKKLSLPGEQLMMI